MSYKYLHDGKEHFINGVGTELAWGWSPAIDFTEILERREKHATDGTEYVAEETKEEPEESTTTNGDNVKKDRKSDLDIDAMIAAIQQRIPKEKKDEGSREIWLLDSMFSLDELEEQVLMFLDVFGNALTRDTTSAQSRSVSQRLLRVLRNEEGELARLVSFTEMKSKERDFVEEQIVHWTFDTSQAKVEDSWLRRLRHEMAERYDNRDNIIDWDFNFYLCDYTNLIKFAEYRTWRNTGIAFDATHINPRRGFTYNYEVPNKTLCHFNAKGIGTFLGDMKNGPFFAFGAQTANTHIRAKTIDGTCKYGNGVVSMHNVRAWLYGLLTGQSWPWSDHAFAWDDPANYNYLPPGTPNDVAHQAVLPDVRFHFIGLDFTRFMQHIREKKNKRFDLAFVGTSCTQLMSPEFFEVAMARNAVVVAETAKFVIDARDGAKSAFVNKIRELARAANWEQNDVLTDLLHVDQPEPPKVDDNSSNMKTQKMALERHQMPYQLALTRSARAPDT